MPHHETFDDKLTAARRMRDEIGIRRAILADDLVGTAHRAYGLLPNMTWVVDRGGTIAYKASWTSADNVAAFLDRYLTARRQRPPSGALSRYHTEQVELRRVDRDLFYRHLRERNGARSYDEFKRAEEIWAGRG